MESLMRDLRFSFRSLARTPLLTSVMALSLAVGIALVSIVFSFINSVFYKPLPYPNADRIVALSVVTSKGYTFWNQQPLEIVEALRHGAVSFDRMAALEERVATLVRHSESSVVSRTAIDTSVLELIGAKAQRGRLLLRDEILQNAPVALITDSLWRSAYSSAEDILSQFIRLDDATYHIVGVLQPGLRFYEHSDIIVPLVERSDSARAGEGKMYVLFGRLRPGLTVAQARADVDHLGRILGEAEPEFKRWRLIVRDRMMSRTGGSGTAARYWLFLGVAISVLLITCTNVANLIYIRSSERRAEIAIRAALGASRGRLVRESLSESLLIGVAAGLVGLFLSECGVRLFLWWVPSIGVPAWVSFGIDARVSVFLCAVTLLAVAACGLRPALSAAEVDLQSSLRASGQSVILSRDALVNSRRAALVQIAISTMLIVGTGLLWHSYLNLTSLDLGFDAKRILSLSIDWDHSRFATDISRAEFSREVGVRAMADPRVKSVALRTSGALLRVDAGELERHDRAAVTGDKPLTFDDAVGIFLPIEPTRSADHNLRPQVQRLGVSESYFQTINLRLIAGRAFDASDRETSPAVAVVSEQFALSTWHRADVVGETFKIGRRGTSISVIGLISNVTQPMNVSDGLKAVHLPLVYLLDRQSTLHDPTTLVRVDDNPDAIRQALIAAVKATDDRAVIRRLETLSEEGRQLDKPLFVAGMVLGGMAACGLVISFIGIYGVVSYGVRQRTKEIGLRLALGATPWQVVRQFMSEGARIIAYGMIGGIVLAVGASILLRSFLLGVSPVDPRAYLLALIIFGGAGAVACWVPARLAASIDPGMTLRAD